MKLDNFGRHTADKRRTEGANFRRIWMTFVDEVATEWLAIV
jgi:hypothetical protein